MRVKGEKEGRMERLREEIERKTKGGEKGER